MTYAVPDYHYHYYYYYYYYYYLLLLLSKFSLITTLKHYITKCLVLEIEQGMLFYLVILGFKRPPIVSDHSCDNGEFASFLNLTLHNREKVDDEKNINTFFFII